MAVNDIALNLTWNKSENKVCAASTHQNVRTSRIRNRTSSDLPSEVSDLSSTSSHPRGASNPELTNKFLVLQVSFCTVIAMCARI